MADAHLRHYTIAGGKHRWELRLRVAGRQKSRSFEDKRAAERWLAYAHAAGSARCLAAIDAEEEPQDVATVRQIVEGHIAALSGIEDGTRDGYTREARRDIYPHLGDMLITQLGSAQVAAWINRLARQGLAGKTIKNRHSLLSAACAGAVTAGHLEVNPCRGARIPRTLRRPPVFLTDDQVRELLALMATRPVWAHHRDLVVTMLGTGMRWGEVTALPARYLRRNGKHLEVHVQQAWKDTDSGVLKLGPPKSPRSVRVIPLAADSPAAVALLRQSDGKAGAEFVFTGRRGGTLRGGTFHDGVWQPLITALGWQPRPRVHDLRHTAASMMIADGAQIDAISRILGHEKTSTTWDTYGHLVPGARETALAGLGARLSGALSVGA